MVDAREEGGIGSTVEETGGNIWRKSGSYCVHAHTHKRAISCSTTRGTRNTPLLPAATRSPVRYRGPYGCLTKGVRNQRQKYEELYTYIQILPFQQSNPAGSSSPAGAALRQTNPPRPNPFPLYVITYNLGQRG